MAMPVQDIDMPARCGPTEAIDQDTQPVTNWLSPKPAARRPTTMTARLTAGDEARHGRDEIEQAAQRADRRALERRALAAVMVGQAPGIAARQHGREELDADRPGRRRDC